MVTLLFSVLILIGVLIGVVLCTIVFYSTFQVETKAGVVVAKRRKDAMLSLGTLILILIILGVLWWVAYNHVKTSIYEGNETNAGLLGDSVNIVTSFFSSLTLGGLFYTIMLQRKELHDAKIEFQKQNENLEQNRFETTFFNLLNSANEMINEIRFMGKNAENKAVFTAIMQKCEKHGDKDEFFKSSIGNPTVWSSRPYIQSLSLLIKFIEDHFTNDQAKDVKEKKYVSIIAATFTSRQKQFIEAMSTSPSHNDSTKIRLRKLVSSYSELIR